MDSPLLLPASLKAASDRIMPKTSCDKRVTTLPWDGSGRRRDRCDPDAVAMSCSLVPANWPRTAETTLLGGWIVSEYMNMLEVVAMFAA